MKRLLLFWILSVCVLHSWSQRPTSHPNVLFLFVDDLRPDLGCYGNKEIHTPNLDRLANSSVRFDQQYVAVPTCGASRASLLTGRLPRIKNDLTNEVLELRRHAHTDTLHPESFIEELRMANYYTIGIGKISHSPDGHIYAYKQPQGPELELPRSWDEMLFNAGKWGTGWNAFFGYANGSNRNTLNGQVKPYEKGDVDDDGYPDGLTAELAVSKLQELASKGRPFFLGVGFFKPHLPFNAPAKYWDMYDESKLSLTPSPEIPLNINKASLNQSEEFNNGYKLGDEQATLEKPVSDAYARKLRHAYYAGVSYVDAQIGKVLAELKRAGLDKNTIVIVWGDHGWHLGDDRVWGKHTLFEWSLRSPLIIHTPGMMKPAQCDEVISSVDFYPTLMELCGLQTKAALDGKSFAHLLVKQDKEPNGSDKSSLTTSGLAYSYFNKGITMRTSRYRITKYFRSGQPVIELYDHEKDPYEQNNIAEKEPAIVQQLLPLLEKGNTGLYAK
jgi:arylsulfatase A-like enzyme